VDGGIAYLELSYALGQGVPYGQVRNRSGAYVQPCPATVSRAAEGLAYPPDLQLNLTDSAQPDAYPITGAAYLLAYAEQRDPATAAALAAFLAWILTTGQDLVAPLGYGPLGPQLQALAYARVGQIAIGGARVAQGSPASSSPPRPAAGP
jgi:phosphate transport system substrate-binding protein